MNTNSINDINILNTSSVSPIDNNVIHNTTTTSSVLPDNISIPISPIQDIGTKITDVKPLKVRYNKDGSIDKRKLFVKGDPRINRKGKPRGITQVTDRMRKKLNNKIADKIVDTMFEQAISGSFKHTELVVKLNGELNDNPLINVTNNNNTIISDEIMERAINYCKGLNNNILDIEEVNKNKSITTSSIKQIEDKPIDNIIPTTSTSMEDRLLLYLKKNNNI
jgi:hypothetical protein